MVSRPACSIVLHEFPNENDENQRREWWHPGVTETRSTKEQGYEMTDDFTAASCYFQVIDLVTSGAFWLLHKANSSAATIRVMQHSSELPLHRGEYQSFTSVIVYSQ